MATMTVEVVSPERRLFSGEASEVYARSLEGEIGILPGHQPCLLALEHAPLTVKTQDGTRNVYAVHGGFLYFRDNHLVVLADVAEAAADIDVARAEAERTRFEREFADSGAEEARLAARRAAVRVRVARGT